MRRLGRDDCRPWLGDARLWSNCAPTAEPGRCRDQPTPARPHSTCAKGRPAVDLELTGRTGLVIGGSSGIGAATVEVLAEEGCDVVVTYRSFVDGAQRSAARVRELARRAWVLPLDLRSPEAVTQAAQELSSIVDALDVLVVAAGYNVITPFRQIGVPEWREVVDVNLTGVFSAVQAITPLIRSGGAIVTVASVAAHTGAPHHMHYAAAKAGLVNLTRSLARELAPGIRVSPRHHPDADGAGHRRQPRCGLRHYEPVAAAFRHAAACRANDRGRCQPGGRVHDRRGRRREQRPLPEMISRERVRTWPAQRQDRL